MARPRRCRRNLTRPDKAAPPAPDLLRRDFTASRPDEKWCGDFKHISTQQGPVYLATVEDLVRRELQRHQPPGVKPAFKAGPVPSPVLSAQKRTSSQQNKDAWTGCLMHIDGCEWPGTLSKHWNNSPNLYQTGQIPEYHSTVDTILKLVNRDPRLAPQPPFQRTPRRHQQPHPNPPQNRPRIHQPPQLRRQKPPTGMTPKPPGSSNPSQQFAKGSKFLDFSWT